MKWLSIGITVAVVALVVGGLLSLEGGVLAAAGGLFGGLVGRRKRDPTLAQTAQDAAVAEMQNDPTSIADRFRDGGFTVRQLEEMPEEIREALDRATGGERGAPRPGPE